MRVTEAARLRTRMEALLTVFAGDRYACAPCLKSSLPGERRSCPCVHTAWRERLRSGQVCTTPNDAPALLRSSRKHGVTVHPAHFPASI
jgi:hypothetical protein